MNLKYPRNLRLQIPRPEVDVNDNTAEVSHRFPLHKSAPSLCPAPGSKQMCPLVGLNPILYKLNCFTMKFQKSIYILTYFLWKLHTICKYFSKQIENFYWIKNMAIQSHR